MKIVGHTEVRERLRKMKDRLPPSLLFAGPEGIGKKLAALEFARELTGETRSLDLTQSISQTESLFFVSPDGASIKIEQVRDAIHFLSLARDGKPLVLIFDQAHLIGPQAANALLKSVEEPPMGVHFFFLTPSPSLMLSTLRSRSQVVRFAPLSNDEVRTVLKSAQPELKSEAWAIEMSGGSPGAALELLRGGDEAVSVTARIDEGVPVHTGAVAYIKRNLVTGIAAVEIDNGSSANPLLVQAPQGERYPVIAEGSSDIDKVATAVSRLSVNGAQVLEKMNALLSEDNQRAIGRTLANLDELSSHLAANKQSLDALVQGMRDASDEFRFAGASISQAATRAEGSIVGVGDHANTALKEAVVAMEKLQRDATLIAARVQQFTDTGSLELTNVSRDVRTSADALATAGQRLSEPRAILFGPSRQQLGPGEKLP